MRPNTHGQRHRTWDVARRETRDQSGDHKGQDDVGSRVFVRGVAGQDEDTGADDAADAQCRQLERAKAAL
jgi:hypothetical protein